ncbi:MAG: signal peptide peptidase SppA [Desulfobacterales bacterium]|nr:signal peptide peptidase SppA [Desulfobacterales bacterium]MDD4070745.1 signal peptide peptidase SppA [Desulfobacterales bacterium]MDD4391147.1 signal peptide peptidase SppA [Desulfobacterales bacterium]
MFSRRHPFLFFSLALTGMLAGTVLMITLIIAVFFRMDYTDTHLSGEKVGIVEVNGVITDSKNLLHDIKQFREDSSIKAILVRINSPGGAVGPSQEIYREIRKTIETKAVVASMGSVVASGGYYIASATSGIMANPGTITGSIGVIMGYTNFQNILDKIGLVPVVVKSGEYKDMGSPVRTMKEEEKIVFQKFVDNIHQQFVNDVALGRHMDVDKLKKLADGRIFTGEQALNSGLVDRLGNLEDAVEWAGRMGGIKGKIASVYARKKKFSLVDYLADSSVNDIVKQVIQPNLHADYVYKPQ